MFPLTYMFQLILPLVSDFIEHETKEKSKMNITDAKNAIHLGNFQIRKDHKNKIELKYLSSIDDSILRDNAPRVYLIVVNNEIFKIGGSAAKGGIKATMSFYVNAMQGNPGAVRFVIHHLIDRELRAKNEVKLFMIVSPKVSAQVYGLNMVKTMEIASYKEMENLAKEEFLAVDGCYPVWNFQENSTSYPEELEKAYVENRGSRPNK